MKKIFFLIFFIPLCLTVHSQQAFTKEDSLRGSITPERAWWDLLKYDLSVSVDPENKSISGSNTIHFKSLKAHQTIQIDLQKPLRIDSVLHCNKKLLFHSIGSAHFVKLNVPIQKNIVDSIVVYYSGKPHKAKRAPWSGGFVWKKDPLGNDFIATACQGLGASIWWPCKDHLADEPDSGMTIQIDVPKGLTAISNGRLLSIDSNALGRNCFLWEVKNPINNYGVTLNIGNYVEFHEIYEGEKGPLDLSYWVLSQNINKAKKHFTQVPKMLKAFEYWFGPYPFYEDGYKLVEVPYLGMEHQSAVSYGNGYKNGYLESDLTYSGWGKKFDYIIIHESGHEWFGNNITDKDIADMWIHESFATYSEALFVEYYYGKEACDEYIQGYRFGIGNRKRIIGEYNVNQEGDGDQYPKGANLIHTLRQLVETDEKWRLILRKLNREFYHATVTTEQIEQFFSKEIGLDLGSFFDQYLRHSNIPVFEYKIDENRLLYRWADCIDSFDFPIKVNLNGAEVMLNPTKKWRRFDLKETKITEFELNKNFYVETKRIE